MLQFPFAKDTTQSQNALEKPVLLSFCLQGILCIENQSLTHFDCVNRGYLHTAAPAVQQGREGTEAGEETHCSALLLVSSAVVGVGGVKEAHSYRWLSASSYLNNQEEAVRFRGDTHGSKCVWLNRD